MRMADSDSDEVGIGGGDITLAVAVGAESEDRAVGFEGESVCNQPVATAVRRCERGRRIGWELLYPQPMM